MVRQSKMPVRQGVWRDLGVAWARLFRYDFFISYAWRDGRAYAEALFERLSSRHGYRCFLDDREMGGGAAWRSTVERALHRSSVLVVIASPAALERDSVFSEIRTFATRRRPIVPIDLAGELAALPRSHRLYGLLEERIRVDEPPAPDGGLVHMPSETVVGFLNASFGFVRVGRIRALILGGALAFFMILSLLLVWFFLAERVAKDQVETRRRLAVASQLAAQSQLAVGGTADQLALATMLAVESLRAQPTADGDTALRRVLALTARPPLRNERVVYEGEVTKASIDGSGEFIALAFPDRIVVQSLDGTRTVFTKTCAECAFAADFDGRRIAISQGGSFSVLDFDHRVLATCIADIQSRSLASMALSADGTLLTATGQFTRSGWFSGRWRIDYDRQSCVPLGRLRGVDVPTAVAFDRLGPLSVVGGQRIGFDFSEQTRVVVEQFAANGPGGSFQIHERARFEAGGVDGAVFTLAVSLGTPDDDPSTPFAVAAGDGTQIVVWMRHADRPFRETVRIGAGPDRLLLLGFGGDRRTLYSLNTSTRMLQQWPIHGQRSVMRVSESGRVVGLMFSSGVLRTSRSETALPASYLGEFLKPDRVAEDGLHDGFAPTINGSAVISWFGDDIRLSRRGGAIEQFRRPEGVSEMRLAPDRSGATLAFTRCGYDSKCEVGRLDVANLGSGVWPRGRSIPRSVSAVAIDPGGERIAVGLREDDGWGAVTLYRAQSSDPAEWQTVFQVQGGGVAALALRDDRLAIAEGNDVVIWDLVRREVEARIRLAYPVSAVAYSEDGRYLATSIAPPSTPIIDSEDHYISEVWLLDRQALIRDACAKFARNLDPESEWPRYMGDLPFRPTCPAAPG